MRWSVVRLISAREMKDQLRDRRTIFLILGLPVLMYPLFVGVGILFVAALKEKKLVVGVVGAEFLPQPRSEVSPTASAVGGGPAGYVFSKNRSFPPLIVNGKFSEHFLVDDPEGVSLIVKNVEKTDEEVLTSRQADVLLVIEPDFLAKLERQERPTVRVIEREGEENSKLAVRRLVQVLRRWADSVKVARFARAGLTADFDSPIEIRDPNSDKPLARKVIDELRDGLVKIIPFLLM